LEPFKKHAVGSRKGQRVLKKFLYGYLHRILGEVGEKKNKNDRGRHFMNNPRQEGTGNDLPTRLCARGKRTSGRSRTNSGVIKEERFILRFLAGGGKRESSSKRGRIPMRILGVVQTVVPQKAGNIQEKSLFCDGGQKEGKRTQRHCVSGPEGGSEKAVVMKTEGIAGGIKRREKRRNKKGLPFSGMDWLTQEKIKSRTFAALGSTTI